MGRGETGVCWQRLFRFRTLPRFYACAGSVTAITALRERTSAI